MFGGLSVEGSPPGGEVVVHAVDVPGGVPALGLVGCDICAVCVSWLYACGGVQGGAVEGDAAAY